MVRRRVVEARVAAHGQTVLHDREAMGDQLRVPHDLIRVGALVVRIGVDDLVVDQLAVDREIAVLGAHVGHLHAVGDRRVHAEARGPAEEAHLMALGLDRDLDAERAQEPVRPEPRAVDDDGRIDIDAL